MFRFFLAEMEIWDKSAFSRRHPSRASEKGNRLSRMALRDQKAEWNGACFYSCVNQELSKFAQRGARRADMFNGNREWRELCELASKEQDPEKLRALIAELIKVLDERKRPQEPTQT